MNATGTYFVRRGNERGRGDHGWLKTWHTFSFSDYYDPAHMQFRSLRVMNEDYVAPGRGFGTHPHRDMEIVTYVLEGELEHRDSMGHREVLTAGEFQRISAGTGITHSEFNASHESTVHLYQIWLMPIRRGLTPSYEQRKFEDAELKNHLRLVASPNREAESLLIQQDARIFLARCDAAIKLEHTLAEHRHAWVQILRGSVKIFGETLNASDGIAISDTQNVSIETATPAEIMLFDLA